MKVSQAIKSPLAESLIEQGIVNMNITNVSPLVEYNAIQFGVDDYRFIPITIETN
jgi:hypothetical protein